MQRPWLRVLFVFLVSFVGFEFFTGLVYLYVSQRDPFVFCLWGGVLGATTLAYLEHDRATRASEKKSDTS
jgi:hemolysin-activating ACP:hemolysin acyltransferase